MRWTPEVVVTLLVRTGGLVIAVLFVRRAVSAVLSAWVFVPQMKYIGVASFITESVGAVWNLGLLAVGCYCFFSGRWVVRRLLGGLGPSSTCRKCGYELRGVPMGRRCPECGTIRS